jgi:DNA invertase Pin-like site-specific DNA recombinase
MRYPPEEGGRVRNGTRPGLVVLYDRASTARQQGNWSRSDAARFLDQVVAERGCQGETRQEIRSGESLVDRPVMKQLLEEIAEGRIAALACQDFSRLSRDEDGIDGRIIRQVCRDAGTLIITPEKTYDFDNDGDDLLADLNFFVGKIHKRQSLLALTRGLREKARQGALQPTYARFGYEWSQRWPDDGSVPGVKAGAKKPGANLLVVPEEAAVAQKIFDLYEHMSQRQVAIRLNAEGRRKPIKARAWRKKMQTREAGERLFVERPQEQLEREWTPKDIYDIVCCKLYAGLLVWGEECKSRFLRDFEGAQHFRPDLQIISVEQFNRCQKVMEERKKVPPTSVSSPYLFSGLLRCRHCQGRTVGKQQRRNRADGEVKKRLYTCRSYHNLGSRACRGQTTYEDIVKQAMLPALFDLLEKRLRLGDALEEVAREMATPSAPRKEGLLAQLAEIDAAQKRLVDAVAEGVLPKDAVRRKQLELEERREGIEKKAAALERRRETTSEVADALRLVQTDLGQLLAGAPDQLLTRLVRLIFRWFTVESVHVNEHKPPRIGDYEFTPEFADLLASQGANVDGPLCDHAQVTPASNSSPFEGVKVGVTVGRAVRVAEGGGAVCVACGVRVVVAVFVGDGVTVAVSVGVGVGEGQSGDTISMTSMSSRYTDAPVDPAIAMRIEPLTALQLMAASKLQEVSTNDVGPSHVSSEPWSSYEHSFGISRLMPASRETTRPLNRYVAPPARSNDWNKYPTLDVAVSTPAGLLSGGIGVVAKSMPAHCHPVVSPAKSPLTIRLPPPATPADARNANSAATAANGSASSSAKRRRARTTPFAFHGGGIASYPRGAHTHATPLA